MRMEKINSNQIRVMLTEQDLNDLQISIRDMKYGSKETTELFRQMIQKAMQQYSFNEDGLPLMIEAVPVAQDALLLIISAVEDAEELDPHFASFAAPSPALPGFSEEQSRPAYDTDGKGNGLPRAIVLSFANIDAVMEFAWSIGDSYGGHSDLYRDASGNGFYLVLERPEQMEKDAFLHFMNGLSEYADIVPGSGMIYGYLTEHETPVMKDPIRVFAGF